MKPSEKELDIFELELAIKWAHAAARMDANPEVSYLFALSETALREKLERMNSASPPNDPLTLEELREVGGQPYWHVGLQDDSPPPHWSILDPFFAKHIEDYGYGVRWLAYRRKPEEGTA